MEDQNQEIKTQAAPGETTPINPPTKPQKKKGHLLEAFKQLLLKIRDVFQEYPITMGAIIIAAFIGSLMVGPIDYETQAYETCEKAVAFFLILSVQTLTFEEIFRKKLPVRIAGLVVSSLISLFCVFVFYSKAELLFGAPADTVKDILRRIISVYFTFMLGFSIYHMFRRLEEDFEIYATRAFLELLKASVIYGLFALGLAIIIWIFNELIFDTKDLMEMVELFLAGGIYTPMCIKAISGKNEAPGKFFRFCILYVLQPMLLLAFAIIYLYIIKIFVANEIPSNRIFWILSFLFSVGMPVWTMIHGMKEKEGFVTKATQFLPYVFVPFVLLQCWSIGVRIGEYGMTSSRYGAVVLIICECIYFILYLLHHLKQKETISYILFALMAVSFFGILFPGTCYDDVVIRSQMKRINAILESNTLSTTDKEIMSEIKSSYRVISRAESYKSKKVLEERFSKDEIETIESFNEYSSSYNQTLYLRDYECFAGYDITPYKAAYPVSLSDEPKKGMATFQIRTKRDDGTVNYDTFEVDLSELVDWTISNYDRSNSNEFSLRGHEKYTISPEFDLILDQVSINLDTKKKTITYLHAEGFAMQK